MATCPACDADDLEVDEFDVEEGDVVNCPECGASLVVNSLSPLEFETADDDERMTSSPALVEPTTSTPTTAKATSRRERMLQAGRAASSVITVRSWKGSRRHPRGRSRTPPAS